MPSFTPIPPEDLAQAFAASQRSWPSLNLALEDFGLCLETHGLQPAAVPSDILVDLFLAQACARKVPGAVRAFREKYFFVVSLAVRSYDDSRNFAEEVFQHLSENLFVEEGEAEPRIATYSGQGSLAGFVATSAKRIAHRLHEKSARSQGDDALIEQFTRLQDPETDFIKHQYRELFNLSLAKAIRRLPARDRLVLRMNLVQKISTTRISTMYRVNQSTVSRWIQGSAQRIFGMVKEMVCDGMDIDTREMESMLLKVRSEIDVTISSASGNPFSS